uniref:Tetrapyrrole methylase domain-containing protein n=1 Tax=Salix viminalis TaxID=40686 RepID=A0A6N2KU59_SALVM
MINMALVYKLQAFSSFSVSAQNYNRVCKENDIALQLPELKKLLEVLKRKRESCCGNDGDEKCGLGMVFGRGGEEIDFLQQQGIQVKVVPGITSASGIAAELGIPLTHRGVANSVRFLTGHSRKGGTDPLFVAENAADPDSTLVVYMGLSTLPALALKLMQHGLPANTPAAAVERGTTPQQRMVFAELNDLADKVAQEELVSPTLIIIGKVVALSPLWPLSSKEASCLMEAV